MDGMEKILINNDCSLLEIIKSGDNDLVDDTLREYCENDAGLYGVLRAFVDAGFVTTSSSCGHIFEDWKDPVYVAVYASRQNVTMLLNLVYLLDKCLSAEESKLVHYNLNYNANRSGAGKVFINYMFGIQVDVFEECEIKQAILSKIATCIGELKTSGASEVVALNYNFIYVFTRLIYYQCKFTDWINISFDACSLADGFSLILRMDENDGFIISKTYNYADGLSDFEYELGF